mmetsp:Transcript_12744/g.23145  ORF Transcript_12744/g.23145 Transcript_12744/m.23145 type:complete len:87 (+) Transcript_12744:145-405(+)|eukprot:CAMPEP_0202482382 /NCGR_PEP_ID=MMETSP1361-20130828/1795_1 /ASSEMBLY_ACC=CAM_ASM_000849 /TAXON_ID=210615 /ORGANISM="Staurosira complex sp., Strain CCMP2646" /LENGTH=86 /DNA_ID=CAMNT_0049110237 /DNA_START=40 /DNA_END=300 /DNA_ORIENTATION=-
MAEASKNTKGISTNLSSMAEDERFMAVETAAFLQFLKKRCSATVVKAIIKNDEQHEMKAESPTHHHHTMPSFKSRHTLMAIQGKKV